jgi:hypothetical protein
VTGSERRAVERLVEASVRPGDELPGVDRTDAVAAFDAWLRAAPRPNRVALRALLRAVARGDVEQRIEAGRGVLAEGARLLARIAAHCYYGDERVMRSLGYDAGAVAARGLALRRAEDRP